MDNSESFALRQLPHEIQLLRKRGPRGGIKSPGSHAVNKTRRCESGCIAKAAPAAHRQARCRDPQGSGSPGNPSSLPSGNAEAAPRPRPYRSGSAAVPELPATHRPRRRSRGKAGGDYASSGPRRRRRAPLHPRASSGDLRLAARCRREISAAPSWAHARALTPLVVTAGLGVRLRGRGAVAMPLRPWKDLGFWIRIPGSQGSRAEAGAARARGGG
ncbi:uncharacterized protein LOC117072956 [Trachypithecus francoisi]|uniref:uncharacterized protein LOC117072956 n=1 Tax=Trachypithecus francoisi TaxID=54180 RepID=UPI00141BAB21|nr:uncharacterized protein LOC117072956 [Trachypithecus francoisi]